MFQARGLTLRMTRGDFGIPLSIHLATHCANCGEQMDGTDIIRVSIERDDVALVVREASWAVIKAAGGYHTLALTEEETQRLDLGLYTWRVYLIRDGAVCHTLVTETMEVVP